MDSKRNEAGLIYDGVFNLFKFRGYTPEQPEEKDCKLVYNAIVKDGYLMTTAVTDKGRVTALIVGYDSPYIKPDKLKTLISSDGYYIVILPDDKFPASTPASRKRFMEKFTQPIELGKYSYVIMNLPTHCEFHLVEKMKEADYKFLTEVHLVKKDNLSRICIDDPCVFWCGGIKRGDIIVSESFSETGGMSHTPDLVAFV